MSNLKNILIVDDDDFVLSLLEKAIVDHPEYQTQKAANAEEALLIIQDKEFDLIITDIIMPGKDGIQLISEIRKTDKSTPVIAISGGDSEKENDAEQYINFACYFANETLTKPFTKEDLYRAIDMVLNNREADALKFL